MAGKYARWQCHICRLPIDNPDKVIVGNIAACREDCKARAMREFRVARMIIQAAVDQFIAELSGKKAPA